MKLKCKKCSKVVSGITERQVRLLMLQHLIKHADDNEVSKVLEKLNKFYGEEKNGS